jgi:hypothetical protein
MLYLHITVGAQRKRILNHEYMQALPIVKQQAAQIHLTKHQQKSGRLPVEERVQSMQV